jgi:hypothetical protein
LLIAVSGITTRYAAVNKPTVKRHYIRRIKRISLPSIKEVVYVGWHSTSCYGLSQSTGSSRINHAKELNTSIYPWHKAKEAVASKTMPDQNERTIGLKPVVNKISSFLQECCII